MTKPAPTKCPCTEACRVHTRNEGIAEACQSLKTTVILRPDTLKTTRRITTPRQITRLFQPCPSGGPRLSIEPVLPVAQGLTGLALPGQKRSRFPAFSAG